MHSDSALVSVRQDGLNPVIVGELQDCSTSRLIGDTFNKYAITPFEERVVYLNQAMGNPQTFFSSENLADEMRYEVTERMFLSGTWKLAELYKKAGF
jgi:hypothetical protein